MKKFIAGIVVGAIVATASTAAAAPLKQLVVTVANYPIFVNGKAYTDSKPVLVHEGTTYVPLASLGRLTGADVKWDAKLKQVIVAGNTLTEADIQKMQAKLAEEASIKAELNKPGTVEVVKPKGLVEEDGQAVFYAYNRDGVFGGRFTDNDNAAYVIAQIRKDPLPPSIADGWLGIGFLCKAYYDADSEFDGKDYVVKTRPTQMEKKEYLRFPLSKEFWDKRDGETVSNGVRIKVVNNGMYLNIADLQKAGILQ